MSSGAVVAMSLLGLFVPTLLCAAASSWGGFVPDRPGDIESIPTSGSVLLDRWSQEWEGLELNGKKDHRCEPIEPSVGLCRQFGYPYAMMPNFLGLRTQDEAAGQLFAYKQVLNISCHEDFVFLLCTYYFPPCNPRVTTPIQACRNLCRRVKEKCAPRIEALGHGLRWPETINCDELLVEPYIDPRREMAHLCVNSSSAVEEATGATTTQEPITRGAHRPEPATLPTPTEPAVGEVEQPEESPQKQTCPRRCRSLKLKRKYLKRKVVNWIIRGVVDPSNLTVHNSDHGDLNCVIVNITHTYYSPIDLSSRSDNSDTTVVVCQQRPSANCSFCIRLKPKKQYLMAGHASTSDYLLMKPSAYMFLRYRASNMEPDITNWVRRYYKGRDRTASARAQG